MAWLVLFALALLAFSYRNLRGDNLSYLDTRVVPTPVGTPSDAHGEIVEQLQAFSDTGPHHRWSVGTLFDNVKVSGNAINVQDRQASGTGHGWAGALKVLWNCEADSIVCQKPPTSQNYAIGCVAEKASGWHEREDGHWESHGEQVEPRSLYYTQLKDRMGEEAVKAVGAEWQL